MPKKTSSKTTPSLEHMLELREKICARNQDVPVHNVNGTFEMVNHPDAASSVTLWINREPGGFPLHWHQMAELIMPVSSPYTVVINKNIYRLNPDDILLIPPGELHELLPETSGLRLILLFDFSSLSRFGGFTMFFSLLSRPFLISSETMPDICEKERLLLLQIAEEYAAPDPFSDPAILSCLIRFFLTLARSGMLPAALTASSVTTGKQRKYVEKFNLVFDYIERNYTEDISLEAAASLIGFSKFHFSRLFRQFTNTSFYDYLCLRRLKAAEALLLNPSLPITDIALQSGFSSISTFNRVFKKYKNCTPTEFKEFYSSSRRGISSLSQTAPEKMP